MSKKNPSIYRCDKCLFVTSNKKDYGRHLLTLKHQDAHQDTHPIDDKLTNKTQKIPANIDHNKCPFCGKLFKFRTSVYRHKPTCSGYSVQHQAPIPPIQSSPTHTEQQLYEIIAKNQEMSAAMMGLIKHNNDLQSQMMELCSKTNNMVYSNNSHNTYNNQSYSLNFFLNEQCKDAMNLKDFVNSIQLNMTDLENVGKLGYVEGMSNIIIDNLQKTALHKRPVHCSDVKRETLYVKDNNKWEREGPDHTKMVNAVLSVEHKNVGLLGEWATAHPKCLDSNSRDNEQYFKLSKIVTDGEKDGNIAKVIRRVSKNVMIDK